MYLSVPAKLFDYAIAGGQSQPWPTANLFRGEKWLKHVAHHFCIHTLTVVFDRQRGVRGVSRAARRGPAREIGWRDRVSMTRLPPEGMASRALAARVSGLPNTSSVR